MWTWTLNFNWSFKAVAVLTLSYHFLVSNVHLLYQKETGRAWNRSHSKEITESVEILFWSYSVVSFAAQTNVVTHFLRNIILHCQAYEGSNQISIVQFGSFRDFLFFFNYYGTKDICFGDGREEFSNEQNIPKTGWGRGGFRTTRTVGYKMETSVTFTSVNVMPLWRILGDKREPFLSSVIYWDPSASKPLKIQLCTSLQMGQTLF